MIIYEYAITDLNRKDNTLDIYLINTYRRFDFLNDFSQTFYRQAVLALNNNTKQKKKKKNVVTYIG